MKIADVMTTPVIGIEPNATIADATRLMLEKRISGLPVITREGALAGIVTEGDFLRRGELGTAKKRPRWIEVLMSANKVAGEYVQSHGRLVSEIMSTRIVTASPRDDLDDCVDAMIRYGVKRLPVVDGGKVVGIITRSDFLRALSDKLSRQAAATTDAQIRQKIFAELDAQNWLNSQTIQVIVKQGVVELSGVIFDERARQGLIVVAENVPGVKSVTETLTLVEPFSGTPMPLPM